MPNCLALCSCARLQVGEVEAIQLDHPVTLTRLRRCFDGPAYRSIVQALRQATEDILEGIAATVR